MAEAMGDSGMAGAESVPWTTLEAQATQLAAARSNTGLKSVAVPALQAAALPPAVIAALAQIGLEVALGVAEPPALVPASVVQMTAPSALPPTLMAVLAQLGRTVQTATAAALLEVNDIAAVLGVTRWTIYRWAAQGRIPCIRAGRKVRFELERVLAALRSEGPCAETPPAVTSSSVTASPWAMRAALPQERPRRRRVAGSIPRALPPHRSQSTSSAQRVRAPARQEPVDEIARRRAVVAATRALSE
jgi:excisionase family DNA binding protein